MRRLAVIAGVTAAFFAVVALALASGTPNVSYTSPIKQKGKPKPGKPVPVKYNGILDISEPDGTQPPTGATTTLYFDKGFVQMSKYFPTCTKDDIDGKTSIPAKCAKAKVGQGTASSQAGTPGTVAPIKEDLTVDAYNDAKHKQFLLVLNATSPVAIQNRVIPGQLGPGGHGFGYTLKFVVPQDLQQQLGLQISLTHFDVVTSNRTIKAKIKGKKRKVSYLMLKKCPKSKKLKVKAVVNFNSDTGAVGGGPTVTNTSTTRCK